MTTPDRTVSEQKLGLWTGPTLRAATTLPTPLPLCADCPAAWWYQAADQYECFCTKFRSTIFDKGRPPVTACDARAEAITEADARTPPPI